MIFRDLASRSKGNNRRRAAWIFLMFSFLLVSGCDPKPISSTNVVLIVMDTARQDRLSAYGYNRETSPNLARLAEESTTYTRAYTPGGWTPPAHASLFTGLFPIAHQTTQEAWKLGDQLTTLAEVFKSHGYKTMAIVENPMLNTRNNFNQGFSTYVETWRFRDQDDGDTPSLLRKNLAGRNASRPVFLFINLIEPHSPYNSSKQFYYEYVTDRTINVEANMWPEYFLGERPFSQGEIRHLNELYDAELLYTDYVLGQIMEEMRKANLWDDTVLIVTSDHGENIGDHDMMDHVFSLHESVIRVPLVIRYPRLFVEGVREESPVQLTDIFPTLLGIIGVETARYPNQGTNFLDRPKEEKAAVFSEYYYPKQVLDGIAKKGLIQDEKQSTPLDRYKRRIRAVIQGDMKLIWGSDGNHELYNLRLDPGEHQNLIDDPTEAETRRKLLVLLDNFVARYDMNTKKTAPVKNEALDPATRDRIKSLGYMQ